MVKYNLGDIGVVPSSTSFVDIMLSRTNRQTPTIVRCRWKISSIRSFYMRKIRFTQQNMVKRLNKILCEFPKLDSIHPFYSDLMNVLYDRDHYKIALSQLNIAKQLINNIGCDYIKLLKYGDSLYRCKHLKRAALGRMVKIIKKQSHTLLYLERVRQHISRLPTIDPFASTLLLTGFPSTGKSSFMNKITSANVEIAQYPFTTKSLYVGHCDYNYLRYQIIDSPGILDRELNERNTIEMQTIIALAHLNCCILYFIDLSPFTNYSIQQQCKLFHSLSPLFNNKPIIVICNKTDLRKFEQLSNNEKNLILKIGNMKNVKMMEMSNESEFNIINVRNEACNVLLSHRIEIKTSSSVNKLKNIENRLFVAQPIKRDNKIREITKKPMSLNKNNKNIKEIEAEHGGPGVFNFDTRNHWNLTNNEWKYDPIPQFYDGKNIADFYQNNIEKQLESLENEEKDIMINNDNNNNNDNDEAEHELNDDDKLLALYIERKHNLMRKQSSYNRKTRDSRPDISRNDKKISMKSMKDSLGDLGINTMRITKTIRNENKLKEESLFNRRGRSRFRTNTATTNDNGSSSKSGLDFQAMARLQSRSRSKSKSAILRNKRRTPSKGISSITASQSAHKLKEKAISSLNKKGKSHESDRRIYNPKPIHLFKGKNKPKGR